MPMPARRRDQGSQSLDQFERRHEQADTAAGAGLDALVDQMFWVDLAQSFAREDRTGAVAEQALKAGSVVGLDAHAGIDDLLKLKPLQDAEARVIGHEPGKGRFARLTGALKMETPDGKCFRLGAGLTDAARRNPPPVDSLVTYRYQSLTPKGLPRFPRYWRVRGEP